LATKDPNDPRSDHLQPEICVTCQSTKYEEKDKTSALNDKLFRKYYEENEECPPELFSLSTIYEEIKAQMDVNGDEVKDLFEHPEIQLGEVIDIH